MQEILKKLFGEAVTEDALKQFNAELGKKFVAKADHNTKIGELKTANDTIQTLNDELQKLKDSNATAEDWQKKFEDLQEEIKTKEDEAKKKAEDEALTDAIVEVFGDKKFTSDYVRNGIIADMKSEIAKPENKGKGYAEIFETLTKDKTGIFENPNPPADMTGMGTIQTDGKGGKVEIPKLF